jgi:hypothetical protein
MEGQVDATAIARMTPDELRQLDAYQLESLTTQVTAMMMGATLRAEEAKGERDKFAAEAAAYNVAHQNYVEAKQEFSRYRQMGSMLQSLVKVQTSV